MGLNELIQKWNEDLNNSISTEYVLKKDMVDLITKWSDDLNNSISTEYISKKSIIDIINRWEPQKETISWGNKDDSGIQYKPKTYISSEILEELKKKCPTNS